MKSISKFEPIQKFIKTVGRNIENYFGKNDACIIHLKPDGVFYAEGLYQWLRKRKKNITLTTMEDNGEGLEENKVRGRKVLVVDNDIVTGKGYKRSMEALRYKKEKLGIKDIKFATYFDRVGLADFSITQYSPEAIWYLEKLDALDLKIISHLSKDGRKSFAEIGEKINLSSVAVKNRIDKLLKNKILKIQGVLYIDQFYTLSAQVQIEADEKTTLKLIEKFEKLHEVYQLVRVSGRYNLLVGMLAYNLESIEEFVGGKVRRLPGVKQIDVQIGEPPIIPKIFSPPKFQL